ncbi:MAG: T9SS type A sorting domain-containing protein [Bacteroidia bacterium]|nr:T9SS type A sorting domain-containing protein [Bacteroidia bacterium]
MKKQSSNFIKHKAVLFLVCLFIISNHQLQSQTGLIPFTVAQLPPPASPVISSSGGTAICQGGFVTLSSSSNTGNIWSNGATTTSIVVNSAGSYSVSVSANGCTAASNPVNISVSTININLNVTNATCGNANGSATVVVSGGTTPYTTQWSNGDFGLTADSLVAGQYMFQVTDANGCYNSTIVNINTANGPSISTASITNVSCPVGNNGAISISAVGGTTPYTYLWSNGVTTSSVSSLYAGVYDVTVTDANNCVVIQTYSVSQPLPLTINFTSTAALCGSNNGSLNANVTGGTMPYNYLWSANAASQTTVIAVNLSAGIYSCVVTDNKGCQISGSGAVASSTSGPALSFVTTDAGGCGNSNGGSIDMTVTGGSTYTYQWSNGATTEDIGNLAPDNYLVVVTNTNNCSSTGSVTILNASGNINPTICIITVDTITGTNLVVWEKPATANGIQSYNIYREGSALGVYNLVHTQPFSALSQYTDPTANPAVRGWRYKITYLDSCGNETDLSIHHKTIHLAVNQGIGNTVNLAWDQYEGFAYQTFYILRKHASTGWVQIDALPSNLYSYTDLNPPLSGALRYMIEVAPTSGFSCNSTAKDITSTVNTTRSNAKDKTSLTPTDIKESVLFEVNLFPNPAKDVLHISTRNQLITSVKVYDITARLLSQVSLQNNDNKIDISIKDFASGIYLAEIQTAKGIVRKQFVKE